jgi:Protein of unknown function (DUF3738)
MMRALLAERFNLKVHHEMRDMPMYTLVQARSDSAPGPAMTPGGSFFTALQEQLGLKLTGGRGPVDVLFIDSVTPPTDN